MATRISAATGNFTANGTWLTGDSTSENDSEAATTNITTTNTDSTAFTPGTVTCDAVAIKISSIVTPTGTLTVILRNSTLGADVKTVTINCSDLQPDAKGWHVFKFDAATLLSGATNYLVRVTRSVADGASNRVTLYASSGTNLARQLRTTLDASSVSAAIAPASGDKIIFAGEFTGAGTGNSFTVTHDNTATTSFGPTVSGGPPQGVTVNDKCTWQLGTTASTNYYFKYKGVLQINSGGRALFDAASATMGTITAASNKGSTGRVIRTTNATPIACTSIAHGLSTGDIVVIKGVLGNTNANGTFQITVSDANTFTLQDSAGSNIAGNGTHAYPDIPTGLWFCPIACTSTAHGLTTGDQITLTGVVGNAGANGAWFVTTHGADKFLLDGSMGTGAYTSGGAWVKRTNLDSTSTFVLEMDSVANVDTGLEVTGTISGGVLCVVGASKTGKTTIKQSTVIGSDTNSVGSLVTTSGTTVTWVEGAKFQTSWASDGTKTFTLSGTSYTISSVTSTTVLVATASITTGASTTNAASTFAYTGTSKPTVLAVEDTTGWDANDVLAISSSSRRYQDGEHVTIQTVDSSTQITATTAFVSYHSGLNDTNGDVRAEVINLTRNIKIRGVSTTLQGFVYQAAAQGKVACKLTEFYQLGSATTNKRGICTFSGASASGFNLQSCSMHDFVVTSSLVVFAQNTSGHNCPIVNNCVMYRPTTDPNTQLFTNTGSSGSWTFSNNVGITTTASGPSTSVSLSDEGGVFAGNTLSGCSSAALVTLQEGGPVPGGVGVFTGNSFHSNPVSVWSTASSGRWGVIGDGTNSHKMWRTTTGITISNYNGFPALIFNGAVMAGCTSAFLISSGGPNLFFRSFTVDAGANIFGSRAFLITMSGYNQATFLNCLFSQVTPLNVGDIDFTSTSGSGTIYLVFNNCKMAASPVVNVGAVQNLCLGSYILSLQHGQVANDMRMWSFPLGVAAPAANVATDSNVYRTSSPSQKLVPSTASYKLGSGAIQVPVNASTTISPSVYVRKSKASTGDSADYNGAQPRLILLADPSIGVTYDTVLATGSAAIGSWEQLSGTSISFTGSGVARLVVDCDGTTGFINVDDFSCVGQDTTGFKYWGPDLGPTVFGAPAAGSGGLMAPTWVFGSENLLVGA